MNNKEIRYLTAIAEAGSLSRAAENLDMSQSSLSRCLQKIETGFNTCLFHRTVSGLVPTDAGEKYLLCAKQITKLTRDLENELTQMNRLQTGHLVIGTTSLLGAVTLPEILRTFCGVYPGIKIELVEQDPSIIASKLLDGSVDIALLPLPISNPNLEFRTIGSENLVLAVPASDTVNETGPIQQSQGLPLLDLQLISNRNFILTRSGQPLRHAVQRILRAADIHPRIKCETSNLFTALRMVSFGLGASIVPASYCTMLCGINKTVRLYRINETLSPSCEIAACYPSGTTPNGAVSEFIQICKTALSYFHKE